MKTPRTQRSPRGETFKARKMSNLQKLKTVLLRCPETNALRTQANTPDRCPDRLMLFHCEEHASVIAQVLGIRSWWSNRLDHLAKAGAEEKLDDGSSVGNEAE
jgi:hypothetical protein